MSAPPRTEAESRETWITVTFAGGRTIKYWGDPDEAIDWDEFDFDPDEQYEPDDDPSPLPPGENYDYEDEGSEITLEEYEEISLWQEERLRQRDDDDWEEVPEEIEDQYEARPHEPKAQAPVKPVGKPKPTLAIRMADVQPEPVEWLWHPYIPLGKLTSVEGDPGVGKSWLTMALAAQVSRGAKLPGASRAAEPSAVLLLTAEDGAGDTLRPRLDTLGADVSRVHAITEPLAFNTEGAAKLKSEIVGVDAVLVIIDPIVAYLPDRTDMNNASAVRPVLMRLARVAEETGAAILFVRHLSKGAKDKAMYRGLGSIDFTAACRSVLMVGPDPNDVTKRVVAHAKSNLAQTGHSQSYSLKGGRFAWAGRSSLNAEDLGAPPPDADQRTAREEAREFLLQTLAEGPKPALEVFTYADRLRISRATLRRAKGDLGVVADKTPDHWEWSLPRPESDGSGPSQDAQAPGA
jgi:hypothetical protein